MVATDFNSETGQTRLVVQGNRSMSWAGNMWLVAAFSIVGFAIASGFALQGLWLVFPFVGLELVALSAGLYCCLLRLERKEVITITSREVVLERGTCSPQVRYVASRTATRVDFECPPNEFSVGVLNLIMQGNRHRVGECLGRDEKHQLARQLLQVV